MHCFLVPLSHIIRPVCRKNLQIFRSESEESLLARGSRSLAMSWRLRGYTAEMGQRCGVLRADRIIVNKGRREMLLLRGESVLRTYRIALGFEPLGHKVCEGDGRTPEGLYTIDW